MGGVNMKEIKAFQQMYRDGHMNRREFLATMGACDRKIPPIRNLGDGHTIECHRSEEEFVH